MTLTTLITFSRFCYFPHEKQLKFFKVYNKINCEHECLAELTRNACGCVQFFMVRDNTTRICGSIDEKCFRKVEKEFPSHEDSCDCFEPCQTTQYNVEHHLDAMK
jgi:acid-sensing ion channel, other